jgi:cytochrome c oxidase assembly protein subunit 11
MNRATASANRKVALTMAGLAVIMVGAAFASVPLYRLFCQVTGYGGTTQRAERASTEMGTRKITVRFNAEVAGRDLPWDFQPLEREVTLRVGEDHLTFFKARNISNEPTVGVATFNVTPFKAGPYFQKVACFCFDEQTLAAGESTEMGVSFFVDPAIARDPNLTEVTTITLSYSFFRAKDEKARLGTLAAAATGGVN